MIRDLLVGYWPFLYPFAALVLGAAAVRMARGWNRRVARARRSLTEQDAARAGRPSPAPIDVEPMR